MNAGVKPESEWKTLTELKKQMKEGEPYDVDLNPKYWRATITVIINAPDEQSARDEVMVLTSDDVESIVSIEECGEEIKSESGDILSPVIATTDFGGSDKEINDRIAKNEGKKLGEARKQEKNDADDLIDLIEEAEAFLEDLNLGHYTDLQIKLSKTRYRLLKEREARK